MSFLRFQEEEDSSSSATVAGVLIGALAGFAVGMYVSQRVGGFGGLAARVRRHRAAAGDTLPPVADDFIDDAFEDDEIEEESKLAGLEDHVLEAFRNDPILSERAIDIGAIGESTIELTGWVTSEADAVHAVTLARGVPGVNTVVNRIAIGDEEERVADHARLFAEGDEAHTEAHWEGNTVGTGRRRQGSSAEIDRHVDPRVDLAERWSSTEVEIREAADDMEGIAERRARQKKVAKDAGTSAPPAI